MHRYLMVPVLAFAGFTTSAATADTTTVCASGCDFTSIQAAIDAANDGDVINLTDSVYNEGAEIDMRGKAITLKGQNQGPGNASTTIQGQHSHRLIACRNGETSKTILQDLKFSGGLGEADGGGGLLIQGASPTIKNCFFELNKIDALMYGGGVLVSGGSPHFITPTFENNGPINETLLIHGGGMAVFSGHVTMESPWFSLNKALIGGGLFVFNGASASLSVTDPRGIYFLDNTAYGVDSKVFSGEGAGGAIANFGDLTIDGRSPSGESHGQIYNNIAIASNEKGGLGGGIYHIGTSLLVKNTALTRNSATITPSNQSGSGGGIYAVTSITNLVHVSCIQNFPNCVGGPQGSATGLQGEPPVIVIESCTIHGNGDDETDQQIDGLLVMHLGDNHISKHPPPSDCPSDLNGDGQVDAADLGLLLSAWGFCGTP